jgi:phosphoglycerate kinase
LPIRLKTVREIPIKGKRILIRTDFNVPLGPNGEILDDRRIKSSLNTIKFILDRGGSVILMSHLGRPQGKRVSNLSLAPVAKRLSDLLGKDVAFAPDCIGEVVEKMASKLNPGQILMLENLRFHSGEENAEKEPLFVEKLSRIGDVYVNDAFATAHHKHASNYHIAKKFHDVAAGLLVEKEVTILTNLLTQAKEPFYAVIGGSKIESKIGILEALLEKVDGLLIGGGMAFTFLKAMGYEIGNSLVDDEKIDVAQKIIRRAEKKGIDLHLPLDVVCAKSLTDTSETQIISIEDGVPKNWIGADVGPKTLASWKEALSKANTIFWNGPVGVYELKPFQSGTFKLAEIISSKKVMTIIGGGDSAAAVHSLGIDQKITCISTGGGATLEFIELGTLPALEPLTKTIVK